MKRAVIGVEDEGSVDCPFGLGVALSGEQSTRFGQSGCGGFAGGCRQTLELGNGLRTVAVGLQQLGQTEPGLDERREQRDGRAIAFHRCHVIGSLIERDAKAPMGLGEILA